MAFLGIVSGLPAAGKSTLADRLGQDLGLPVVHRDQLRRYVFDGFEDLPGARDRIPHASSRLVTAVLSTIIDAGGGAILDGNFNTVRHMTPVREFVAARNVRTAEVCLWGDHEALRRRFVLRADPPLTDDLRSYFEQVLYRPRVSVLSPPALIEHVDTTDLATLDERYPALLTALRGAAGQAEPRLRDA